MDPVEQTTNVWVMLAERVGPFAATLLLFLIVGGVGLYKFSRYALGEWNQENASHREAMLKQSEKHDNTVLSLVGQLREEQAFIKSDLMAKNEKFAAIAEANTNAVRECTTAMAEFRQSRPCAMPEVIEAVTAKAREEVERAVNEGKRRAMTG